MSHRKRSDFKKWSLSALAGVLAALASPGFHLDFLVWVALVPLLLTLSTPRSLKGGFALGFVSGLFYWGTLLYWIFALYEWAGGLILPAYLLLIGYLSLYWGIFGVVFTLLRRWSATIWIIVAAPSLWVILEFLKAQGPFGFTWGDLAYALYQRPGLIQLASVTGVWGISFALVLINSLFAFGLERAYRARHWRPALPHAVSATVILGLLWGVNVLIPARNGRAGSEIQVAVVQSQVSQRAKGNPTYLKDVLAGYQQLLSEIDREVDLVVLPETITLAGLPLQQRELLEPFAGFAQEHRAYVLLGAVDARDGRYYNSAALISPNGEVIGVYDKVHLVPFGEYIPLRGLLEQLGLLGWIKEAVPGDYARGMSFSPLESGIGKIASPISFESIFPQIARTFIRNGAQLLAAVTNEAWYKGSFALPQHFAMGVLRAVETRRFFLQSSNAGLSGVISPWGEIVAQSPWQEPAIVYATVSLRDNLTWYVRYGDWLVYFAALLLGACATAGRWRAHPSEPST